jgi:hypothetical protein
VGLEHERRLVTASQLKKGAANLKAAEWGERQAAMEEVNRGGADPNGGELERRR